MGHKVSGYSIRGKGSLLGIPGLLHYIDTRAAIETQFHSGYDRVVGFNELSPRQRFFSPSRFSNRAPALIGNAIVFNPALDRLENIQTRSSMEDYFPIWSAPARYGFYVLANFTTPPGNLQHGITLEPTVNGVNDGTNFINFGMGSTDGEPLQRFQYNRRVNGGTVVPGAHSYSSFLPYAHDVTGDISLTSYRVIDNSFRLYLDGVEKHHLTNYPTVTPLEAPRVVQFGHNRGNVNDKTWKLYVSVMFNWLGYTDTQIEAFHNEVTEIMLEYKQAFIALES